MTFNELFIGMRAQDAAALFDLLAVEAYDAIGRDDAFRVPINAEANSDGRAIRIVFNNDDMERDEMTGRTVVDWED
jgi:hypothetical protein